MRDRPLAFVLTWTCYGCWLPGNDRRYVDRDHNRYGTPRLEPDASLLGRSMEQLSGPPLVLSSCARALIAEVIRDHCIKREWFLFAQSVRATHVHVVLEAWDHAPELGSV
jgi:hypothetical protein